uniref:Uncharacterized protein n=1 Tax=Anopheles atroparvus TaxID=41427 RepID=A0AAG5DIA3_ANOAO
MVKDALGLGDLTQREKIEMEVLEGNISGQFFVDQCGKEVLPITRSRSCDAVLRPRVSRLKQQQKDTDDVVRHERAKHRLHANSREQFDDVRALLVQLSPARFGENFQFLQQMLHDGAEWAGTRTGTPRGMVLVEIARNDHVGTDRAQRLANELRVAGAVGGVRLFTQQLGDHLGEAFTKLATRFGQLHAALQVQAEVLERGLVLQRRLDEELQVHVQVLEHVHRWRDALRVAVSDQAGQYRHRPVTAYVLHEETLLAYVQYLLLFLVQHRVAGVRTLGQRQDDVQRHVLAVALHRQLEEPADGRFRPQIGALLGEFLQRQQHHRLDALAWVLQVLEQQIDLIGDIHQRCAGQLRQRADDFHHKQLRGILGQQVTAERSHKRGRTSVVMHVAQHRDEVQLHVDGRLQTFYHRGHLRAHSDRERLRLGGELHACENGRFYLDRVVAVERHPDRMVDVLLFGNHERDRTEHPKRQGPRNWIVRVDHHEEAFQKLVDVQNLLQVLFALLTYAQYPQPGKIRADAEELRQLEEGRVDQDGKRVLFEQLRKTNDRLALVADFARPDAFVQLDEHRVGVAIGFVEEVFVEIVHSHANHGARFI